MGKIQLLVAKDGGETLLDSLAAQEQDERRRLEKGLRELGDRNVVRDASSSDTGKARGNARVEAARVSWVCPRRLHVAVRLAVSSACGGLREQRSGPAARTG